LDENDYKYTSSVDPYLTMPDGNTLDICPALDETACASNCFYDEIYDGNGNCDTTTDSSCVFYATCGCPDDFISPNSYNNIGATDTITYFKYSPLSINEGHVC